MVESVIMFSMLALMVPLLTTQVRLPSTKLAFTVPASLTRM